MIQWLIRGMVYLGSLLMVYNIYGFVRFARYVKRLKSWNANNSLLYIPIGLLVCFLLGYLVVGFFGKPDLVMAGILFGGSIFVFVMYKLLTGVTQRIVDNERLQAELMAAEESNRSKTSFLATMSHEMRTPLNAVIGLDAIALQDETLKPETRERLRQIDASAHHLLDMINDVLDMNYIESGTMTLNVEPFSPRDMLDLVNVLAQTLCGEKGLDYRHEIVGDIEDACVGDVLRLRQVLMSVITNAVKFTPEGGAVSFVTEQTERDGERCTLRFTISDTGIGIDPAFIPRLYDSFAQEDATTTNRFGGSGLGLAITKKLVEMMDGDISVTSEKGKGSVFVITVRLKTVAEAADGAPVGAPEEKRSLAGLHMLIVEDIDINADILADLLELEEITTQRAKDGQMAVDLFSRSPSGHFDAILMDLRMPVMDGLDAARTIRALPREDAKTVPIVALTANAFEADARQSLEAGMNAHLSKPVDTDQLCDTLRQLLAERGQGGRDKR